ncbi:MAG: glycosyltransferase family 39 protein [Candidatus Bathyarchaeia archaeon]
MKLGSFRELLSETIPLISILIGVALVSVSIGPFYNLDTHLEYETTLAVVKQGMPYITSYGSLIDQPPLGFYVSALVFKGVGYSYATGVNVVTLFGLGCTVLVYALGKILYDKLTGVLAAALFAMTPWQMIISRSFLIDVQCLFFSLLFLLVGIHAIRKDSLKLFVASGTFFAIALLTKFYAVFALIPLAVFYLYFRQKNLSRIPALVAYFLPAIFLSYLWYEIIAGEGWLSILGHNDFMVFNLAGYNPSCLFVGIFLLGSIGVLFLPTTALSLLVGFFGRKFYPKTFSIDLMCLITIIVVASVNTCLGFGLNLKCPYLNPVKYDYQFLPFVSLLAASLVSKFLSLYNSANLKEKLNRLLFLVASIGLILLVWSMFFDMLFINVYSIIDYAVFNVELNRDLGYSFFNSAPLGEYSPLIYVQFFGFIFVTAGLVFALINKSGLLHKTNL